MCVICIYVVKSLVPDSELWPPQDVVIESIVGCCLVLVAQTVTLKLSPARLTSDMMTKKYENVMSRIDYVNLNNRVAHKSSLLHRATGK